MAVQREWLSNDICSVAQTLEIVGERWALLVLREAYLDTTRFDDLQANIGCARNILSDRLRKLVANGILERSRYNDRPPRFDYRLTQRGLDLYPAIIALMRWGDRYLATERGPAIVLEHNACGRQTTPRFVCSHCGEPLEAPETKALIGPGALEKLP